MIYVDDMQAEFSPKAGLTYIMCHMFSTKGKAELMEFAVTKLRLKPEWLQGTKKGLLHFDIHTTYRKKAIEKGARVLKYGSHLWCRRVDESMLAMHRFPMYAQRILVCGDRHWWRRKHIKKRLEQFRLGTLIITGGARGADTIAHDVAKELRLLTWVEEAHWDDQGKAAGHIRNRKMLDLKPEKVIAFHNNIEESKGTLDCVTEARRRGISVEIITERTKI